jgi:hypothetical protein
LYERADGIAKSAQTAADRAHAEDLRREASASFWEASVELGDLFLLLLRHAIDHRPEAVRAYLMKALGEDFQELADAVALVEGRL